MLHFILIYMNNIANKNIKQTQNLFFHSMTSIFPEKKKQCPRNSNNRTDPAQVKTRD